MPHQSYHTSCFLQKHRAACFFLFLFFLFFFVLGHYVANMIMVCFPTLFLLASFLNIYVSDPDFLFSCAPCFLALFFFLVILRMTLSDHDWLSLVGLLVQNMSKVLSFLVEKATICWDPPHEVHQYILYQLEWHSCYQISCLTSSQYLGDWHHHLCRQYAPFTVGVGLS